MHCLTSIIYILYVLVYIIIFIWIRNDIRYTINIFYNISTFSPKTTECPEYVKRIAKSMSIVKAARNNTSNMLDNSNIKPDWK